MSGELVFLFYYCGIMVTLGLWANWILKREFKKMNDTSDTDSKGVSQ